MSNNLKAAAQAMANKTNVGNIITNTYPVQQQTPAQTPPMYTRTNGQDILRDLGTQIRIERKMQGLIQRDLASRANVCPHTIGNIENHGWGGTNTIARVVGALGKKLTIN